jgi:hypothetical protein
LEAGFELVRALLQGKANDAAYRNGGVDYEKFTGEHLQQGQ